MVPILIRTKLALVEERLQAVSDAVVSGDPASLESGSQQLRQALAEFSQVVEGQSRTMLASDDVFKARLARVGDALARQREQLARRSALVDRALVAFLPPAPTPTYSHPGGARAGGVARIYAARAS